MIDNVEKVNQNKFPNENFVLLCIGGILIEKCIVRKCEMGNVREFLHYKLGDI